MKNTFLCAVLILWYGGTLSGQSSKIYYSGSGEMIFSFADIEYKGQEGNSLMRWAPFVNLQFFANRDFSQRAGLFSGLAIRNVGYIFDGYRDPVTDIEYKKKFRTYNLGIPLGLKIGNLSKLFFFGGYEAEFPIVYKEKTFDNGDKINKITGWFSSRPENFQHGLLAGFQLPNGLNLKFKYYFSEFHNRDFTESTGVKPYADLKSNIFYFSLSYGMFTDLKQYY